MALTRTGSRPVVGSSKKTISGSVTRARAMATRLRMPPETSAGYLRPISARPTAPRASRTRRTTSRRAQPELLAQGEGHVGGAGQGVEEGAALEDDAVALAHAVELAAGEPGDVHPVDQDAARVGAEEAEQVAEQHRLAAPAAPDDDRDRPRGDLQVDAAQHGLAGGTTWSAPGP